MSSSRLDWQQSLLLLSVLAFVSMTGCAPLTLPVSYIHTERFVDSQPAATAKKTIPIRVKSFEGPSQNPLLVGTKRVGTHDIAGDFLATQEPGRVTQQAVISQLRQKGIIADGPSPLELRGTIDDFSVDVFVDEATGRGEFNAIVRLALEIWDTGSQSRVWRKPYTGKAVRPGFTVVDAHYERTLKAAFDDLITQVRQDKSVLAALQSYEAGSPDGRIVKQRRNGKTPSVLESTPPQIVFLQPSALGPDKMYMKMKKSMTPIVFLISDVSGIVDLKVNDVPGERSEAPVQELNKFGLEGSGFMFKGVKVLKPGVNNIDILAEDRHGNKQTYELTIRRVSQLYKVQ